MAGQDRDNEWVLQNVLTIILSVLAGIAVCASIVGILYGLGVVMVHLGSECTKEKPVVVETSTEVTDTVIQPPPAATVYRHVPDGGEPEIFVMFAKVKKTDAAKYEDYRITMYRGDAVASLIKISEIGFGSFTHPEGGGEEQVGGCPNMNGNYHHVTHECIVVTKATD
eukprot:783414_1